MTTFEAFTQDLVQRSEAMLFFDEVARLAGDRFADIGPLPQEGDIDAALAQLPGAMRAVEDPFNFGRLVLFAGYLAEQGGHVAEVAVAAAERFGEFLATARRAAPDPDEPDVHKLASVATERDPDAASALLIADAAITGLMGLLTRDRHALRLARADPQLLQAARALGGNVSTAYFLAEFLDSSDLAKLVVIAPTQGIGAIVTADGVRNGYHLFTLLDAVMIGTGADQVPGPEVGTEPLAVARGERQLQGELTLQAGLDYFNWSAWTGSGWAEDAPARWVWGELPLRMIPEVDGERVVLIERPRYLRKWDALLGNAVHPEQHPDVTIDRALTSAEVSARLEVCATAPEAARVRLRYAGVSG